MSNIVRLDIDSPTELTDTVQKGGHSGNNKVALKLVKNSKGQYKLVKSKQQGGSAESKTNGNKLLINNGQLVFEDTPYVLKVNDKAITFAERSLASKISQNGYQTLEDSYMSSHLLLGRVLSS